MFKGRTDEGILDRTHDSLAQRITTEGLPHTSAVSKGSSLPDSQTLGRSHAHSYSFRKLIAERPHSPTHWRTNPLQVSQRYPRSHPSTCYLCLRRHPRIQGCPNRSPCQNISPSSSLCSYFIKHSRHSSRRFILLCPVPTESHCDPMSTAVETYSQASPNGKPC